MMTYLLFAIRHIRSTRLHTLINVFGLTVGIAVFTFLATFIYLESTYDHYHQKADRTYKVVSHFTNNQGKEATFGITFGNLAELFRENFATVEEATATYGPDVLDLNVEGARFNKVEVLYADYQFLEIFDFQGFRNVLFARPDQAIISTDFARTIFNDDNVAGKLLELQGSTYEISGVIDLPIDTRFQFNVLLPIVSMDIYEELKNGGLEMETYVALSTDANSGEILNSLAAMYNEQMSIKWPLYQPDNYLMPLKEVYLNDAGVRNKMGNGNKRSLLLIGAVAILILSLALINYLNLYVANAHLRRKEIGIKKVLGVKFHHVAIQSILESLITTVFAGVLALMFLQIMLNMGVAEAFSMRIWSPGEWSTVFWSGYLLSLLAIGSVAGLIPAFGLFSGGSLYADRLKSSKLGGWTVSLVVFQFFITSCLIAGVLFVKLQLSHLRNQNPGFERENVVVIRDLPQPYVENYETLKSTLESSSYIIGVSGSQSEPGGGASGQFLKRVGHTEEDKISTAHIRTMGGFVSVYDLELIHGADFTIDATSDQEQFILNEVAAELLFEKEESVIGEMLDMGGRKGPVVAVAKNFHFQSFRHEVAPMVLNVEKPYYLTLSVKLSAGDPGPALGVIQKGLQLVDPLYTLDYQFIDENFDSQYKAEILTDRIIGYATVIATVISVLGLLALAIFVMNAKIKEIAIRKTLGAPQLDLFWQLSNRLILWILVGNVLAVPVQVYYSKTWVQDYIYQIDLFNLLWILPVSCGLTLLVAIGSVLYRLWMTVRLNPVILLRDE